MVGQSRPKIYIPSTNAISNRYPFITSFRFLAGYTLHAPIPYSRLPTPESQLLYNADSIRINSPRALLFLSKTSPFNNPLPRQKLRDHKMANILVGPVGEMASDARPEGDVEEAPRKKGKKVESVSQSIRPATRATIVRMKTATGTM